MHNNDMEHKFIKNICELVIPLPTVDSCKPISHRMEVKNWKSCDVFINSNTFCIYVDTVLLRFYCTRVFDIKEIEQLLLYYNTTEHSYRVQLPCLPLGTEDPSLPTIYNKDIFEVSRLNNDNIKGRRPIHELNTLQNISCKCKIIVNNDVDNLLQLEKNFTYGFSRLYSGPVTLDGADENVIALWEPNMLSPLQRTIMRVNDEMKDFSREQYKLNFMQLQIPEGHDNPLKFKLQLKADDCLLTDEQYKRLQNILREPLSDDLNQNIVDCGLISILLAICYDVRCTGGEFTCESNWTRSILSTTFCYFEIFETFRDVIISFIRRVLIYPYFRNYELARLCVIDAAKVLKFSRKWLLKQLLITHELFETSERNLSVLNVLYIEHYIRYVCSIEVLNETHASDLSMNVRNALPDIRKRFLGLGLEKIEAEIIREIMSEVSSQVDRETANGTNGGNVFEEVLVSDVNIVDEESENEEFAPAGEESEMMEYVDVDDVNDDDDDDNDEKDDDDDEVDADADADANAGGNDNDDEDVDVDVANKDAEEAQAEANDKEDDDDDDLASESREFKNNENKNIEKLANSDVINEINFGNELSVELSQLQINSTKGAQNANANAHNTEKQATEAGTGIDDGELLLFNVKKKMNEAKWAGCSTSNFNEKSAIQK